MVDLITNHEKPGSVDVERVERIVGQLLDALGENPSREGLLRTPARVAAFYAEVLAGADDDPAAHLDVQFELGHREMVMVRDIPFSSLCEHHLVPFIGRAHVAYIPGSDGRITGLSKLARLVDAYAHRLQVQERLTTQVAETLVERLNPAGVVVVIEAEHLCMTMRGVKKPGSLTVTSAVRGIFEHDAASRAEAMAFIRHGA
ncbi:MAG TPA: GTP cyclohydrolase I FolE [Acidimicrobiales bacterium]|jgi:GTP cyclohydrolase I